MTMISFAEEVAALYFQLKGYLIARNVQIPTTKNNWKDIDLLAYKKENGNNEVLIVNCKADFKEVKDVKNAIRDFEFFTKSLEKNRYSWLLKENKPKLVFFAEHKSQEKYCKEKGYDYITIEEALKFILSSKDFKDIERGGNIGKEVEILPRILKYLKKYEMLK